MKRVRVSQRNLHKDIASCIISFFGNECSYCKSDDSLHIHHIIPLSKGGKNIMYNLCILCKKCHYKAHHNTKMNEVIGQWRKLFWIKSKTLLKKAKNEHDIIIKYQRGNKKINLKL